MTLFNRSWSLVVAAALGLVAQPLPLFAAGGEGGGLFDINPGLSIWAFLILLPLLGVLWKFAWGPILRQLDIREEGIQGSIDEATEARDEARRLLEEHRAQMAEARREASELIAEGKAAGERLRKELEEKARTEARGIMESARREIERERDLAIAELRKESVDLALAAASKLMRERLDAPRDREMVVDYLEDLSRGAEA